MYLLTDSTLAKTSGGTGFYVMAWLPLVVIIIFGIRGFMQRNKNKQA